MIYSRNNRMTELIIREFTIDDYEAMISVWQEAKLPYKPAGGSAFGTHDGRKGWINRVAVAPRYQRQGVAAKLVSEVERRLEAVGIGIIACLIEDWNTESITFFQKIGYHYHKDIMYFTKRQELEI